MSDNIPTLQEPQGIPFFSVKTGETHWCKLEPTIAAYINSSDMGINASRGQDYGWRLAPEWVKKVRAFKRNPTQMSILTAKNQGQKPTTVQILYYMYGEELAAFYEQQEEFENPYEEQYQDAISGNDDRNGTNAAKNVPQALQDFQNDDDDDDMGDLIDDVIADDDDEPAAPQTQASEPSKIPETKPAAKPAESKPAEAKSAAKPADKPADTKQTQK